MSEDMQLQIVLSGTNDSGPAIEQLDEAMTGLKKLTEDIAKQFSDFSRTISQAMDASASGLRSLDDPLQSISTIAEEVGSNASEAMRPLEEGLQTITHNANEARDAIRSVVNEENTASRTNSGGSSSNSSHDNGGLLGMESQMNFMYAGMTTGAMALPMVAAMKQAVGVFGQFDQAVANVNSMLGYTPTEVSALKDQLIQLSKTVPEGPVALANALYGVVGAGVPAADAMNVLKVSAEAATAGQTDVATASNALISVMDSYGMSAKDVSKISDQLFAANAAGAMTFTQFANAIGTVAGPAATAGVSFDQVAAATAALTNEGMSAQRSTQGLRALLMGIVAPTKGATKEAKALGIQWDQNALKNKGMVGMLQEAMKATHGNAQELKKLIPNIAAWTVAVDLGGKGSQSFKNAMDTMAHSSGATARAMAAQEQGFTESMDKMKASIQRVGIVLGSALAPTIERVSQLIGNIATWFSNLNPGMQKAIAIIGALTAAFLVITTGALMFLSGLGALSMGLKSLGIGVAAAEGEVTVFGSVFKAVMTTMLGPWGILIAAVITGVVLIITHWKQISEWVKNNFGISIPHVMGRLKSYIGEAWSAIKQSSLAVWNFLKPYILGSVRAIEVYWKKIWPELKQLFHEVWNAMRAILNPIMSWMRIYIAAVLGFIHGAWRNGWAAIRAYLKFVWDYMVGVIKIAWHLISGIILVALDLLTGHWHKGWNDMKSMLRNVWNDIKGTFSSMARDAYSFGRNFVEMLANGIMGSIHAVENAASRVMNKVKGFFGFHSPTKEGPGAESDQWMPNMMNMFIQGIQTHIPKLQSTLSQAMGAPFQGASASIGHSISQNIAYSGSGFGNNAPNIVVYASGNVTKNEKELGDIVSRAIWDKAKRQGKF